METNLIERPVAGSTVLSLLPSTPKPRAAWTRTLPVAASSPEQARHETTWFLRRCRNTSNDLIENAVLLISELVTNAYTAMAGQAPGTTVDFSLRVFADHLLIEVIDMSNKVPLLNPPCDGCAESGRGLGIVEAISDDWGFFFHDGRKVVYATLLIESDAKAS
jgi:anti-sigma regulatory factor (Ser/Thr protein kinase)